MDELHDGVILQEILDKKDKTIASQKLTISLLETLLYNERLKNANLSDWAKGSLAKSKKTIED